MIQTSPRPFARNSINGTLLSWKPGSSELLLTAQGMMPSTLTHCQASTLIALPDWEATDPNEATALLVDQWCEHRNLQALRAVLEGWPNFGLTEGYERLRAALLAVRAYEPSLQRFEAELLGLTLNALDRTLAAR